MYESLPWHSWSPASPVAAKTVSTKTNDFGRDHSVKKQRSEIVMKIISVWEMCLLHTNWAHVLRTVLELCLPPCALLSHMFLRIPVFLGWCQGSLGLSVKNSNNAPFKKNIGTFPPHTSTFDGAIHYQMAAIQPLHGEKVMERKETLQTPKEWLLALN